MKQKQINGILRNDVCDQCEQHQAMHLSTKCDLCCECYVLNGNPPSDWHTVCVATKEKLMSENEYGMDKCKG